MASPETGTKQITLEKWNEAKKEGGEKGLKGKLTRENLIGQAETKKESVELFKKLLREKSGDNVEITVYWPGRGGKVEKSVILEHDSRKMVKGKEVITEVPGVIKQIVMLSEKKGLPEGISVKVVASWDFGSLKGELIIDTKEQIGQRGFLKEFSTIRNYPFRDQDYKNVVLSVARELDPRYANKSLQEIGKDLKVREIQQKRRGKLKLKAEKKQ